MLISKALGTNSEGNLSIGGADTLALAKTFKTPLYVYDENGQYTQQINDIYANQDIGEK